MAKLNNYLPKTWWGNLVLALVLLLLAYLLASRAIDTGSWWEYTGMLILLILSIKLIIRSFKKLAGSR